MLAAASYGLGFTRFRFGFTRFRFGFTRFRFGFTRFRFGFTRFRFGFTRFPAAHHGCLPPSVALGSPEHLKEVSFAQSVWGNQRYKDPIVQWQGGDCPLMKHEVSKQ
jgi:hypothetical protein